MPYAQDHLKGRIIHDADSHLMELPDCARSVSSIPSIPRGL